MRFVFSKEEDEEEEEEEEEESVKNMFTCISDIVQFFCMQLLFDMLSTLMSLEVSLKVKTENFLMYLT